MDPSHGGPSQGIRNSIPELEKIQVHNEVVCLDSPEAFFLGKDSFPVHALGPSKGHWSYSLKLLPWLLENIGRFDAIIVHGIWLYHSYAVTNALITYKKMHAQHKLNENKVPKLFIMPHGMLDPYFQKASSRRLKAIRNWVYWKFIEKKTINTADGILFTCMEELQLARLTFSPYKPKKELNIGYGIAEPPACSAAIQNAFLECCPEIKGRPYILFLSRINEKKGVDLLLRAYSALLRKNAEVIAPLTNKRSATRELSLGVLLYELPVLVIAGPGLESTYGQTVKQLAAELPASTVFFPGMLTGAAKWGAFYGCEAFVLPSHQENFGIAVVEALACGKPALISNQVNIWREIEASGGGLVEDDTLPGTQRLLERWHALTEPEKLAMSVQAQAAYQDRFAVRSAAEKMAAALQ
ncbi:glycosyltransferase [Hymenobacter sp. UV11]|uniref:glycosyltransferase n=1 Tax=Hymenobacter sp. UV11 TaxID=1849735 RepID=UPI001F0D2B78|nr:glycosyltransferase [Hymenobacter sp. UV11]